MRARVVGGAWLVRDSRNGNHVEVLEEEHFSPFRHEGNNHLNCIKLNRVLGRKK